MKKISRVIQLLPVAGLESFPTHLKNGLAAGVLANWTAAWHPRLIAAAGSAPIVVGAQSTQSPHPDDDDQNYDPAWGDNEDESDNHWDDEFEDDGVFADDLQPASVSSNDSSWQSQPSSESSLPVEFDSAFWEDSLVFVPEVTLETIAMGFAANAVKANAKLVTGLKDRNQIIDRVAQLTEIDLSTASLKSYPHTDNSCGDFFALSYAYLQIQLMTRKIRHSSNLDQSAFDEKLVIAAQAFAEGKKSDCDVAINRCYDLLSQEKNNYYPVRPTLIDLVLTTPKTVGNRLQQEIASKHPTNFLMTAASIEAATEIDGDVIGNLKLAIEDDRASVIGGNAEELPDTLLSPETTLNQLQRGLNRISHCLQYDVRVFMRQRFGLMSSLPNMLQQLDFSGAMHTSLRGGKFPTGSMGTIRWRGDGNVAIIAKAEAMLDASDPATMLDLGVKIGKQIDSAHESTCTFAHWPGRVTQAFEDLIRVASRSQVLGSFTTLDDHFDSLHDPGYDENFSSEEYSAPFLSESIAHQSPVPLSKTVDYWRHYYQLRQIEGLVVMLAVESIKKTSPLSPVKESKTDSQTGATSDRPMGVEDIQSWIDQCDQWQDQIDAATADWNFDQSASHQLNQSLHDAAQQLTNALSTHFETGDQRPAFATLVNPLFFTRQVFATWPPLQPSPQSADLFFKSKRPYLLHQTIAETSHVSAEVKGTSLTPMDFVPIVSAGDKGRLSTFKNTAFKNAAFYSAASKKAASKEPPVLDGDKLQNEFFVATIDRKTGALKNMLYHGQRGNRCSQRLIWRDGPSAPPSTMVCDTFESNAIGVIGGVIKTTGRIVVGDNTVAQFAQTFTLYRGQPILMVDIDLQPTVDVGNSKQKYFAHRAAWRDESCKIFGSDQFVMTELYAPNIQSPNFVQIENLDYSLTILSGGLAYHNRIDRRQLDTLLMTGSETRRNFRIGLGLNLRHPLKSAIDYSTPVLTMPTGLSQVKQFFHVDSKNLLVTRVRPIIDAESGVIGFDFRFQETQRRQGEAKLYLPFKIAQAVRTNFRGEATENLLEDDSDQVNLVQLRYAAADFFQVRVLMVAISDA